MQGDVGDEKDNRERFLLELEFVQCLANPGYINCEFHSSYVLLNGDCKHAVHGSGFLHRACAKPLF